MDYDDSAILPAVIAAGDPLPPEDWVAYASPEPVSARAAAVYIAERPRLARFLRGLAPAQEIGDLVQECFKRLTSSSAYPRVLAEQPRAYLFRTARNLVTERHRTDARRKASDHRSFEEPEHAGPDPHAALEARDQMRRIAAALDRLKPETRDIFLMHRFEGLSYNVNIFFNGRLQHFRRRAVTRRLADGLPLRGAAEGRSPGVCLGVVAAPSSVPRGVGTP
jgi:RNA polymerase sigma-70 factor (ECF subfamily)